MLVHNDFRLFPRSTKTIADEIYFRLDDRKIILRPSLQHKTRPQCGKIGNAGDIKEHVLRKHRRESGKNFLRLPALALKVDNVGLHEDGASITEDRHGLSRKSQVC